MRGIVGAMMAITWSALAFAAVEGAPESLGLDARARAVVIAPHPDDETVAAGGLIHRLVQAHAVVHVVVVTNGDGYPDAVRQALHGRTPQRADYLAYGRRRHREALAGARRLGLPRDAVHFLGFPDGGLDALWQANWPDGRRYTSPYTGADAPPYADVVDPALDYDGENLTAVIARLLRDVQPTVIILPHPDDVHLDHAATARFVIEAAEHLRTRGLLASEATMLTYLVHDPVWPPTASETPTLPPPPGRIHGTHWLGLPLTPAERNAKAAALREHRSQLDFMPDLLHRFLRPSELLGRLEPAALSSIASRH